MNRHILKDRTEITEWLHKMKIYSYYINNGIVSSKDSVNIQNKGLEYIPVQFGKIYGTFNCSFNNLKTLAGCPCWIRDDFRANNNLELSNLIGGPEETGSHYMVHECGLTSLKGGAKKVGNNFDILHNKLKSLKYSPEYVGWDYCCESNQLVNLIGITKNIGGKLYFSSNPFTSLDGLTKKHMYLLEGSLKDEKRFLADTSKTNELKRMIKDLHVKYDKEYIKNKMKKIVVEDKSILTQFNILKKENMDFKKKLILLSMNSNICKFCQHRKDGSLRCKSCGNLYSNFKEA